MAWLTLDEMREHEDCARLFQTTGSLEWFVRNHREQLMEQALVIWGRGRRKTLLWSAEFPKFAVEWLLLESGSEV